MNEVREKSLESLYIADPALAKQVAAKLAKKGKRQSAEELGMLVEESFQGMAQEISFGYAIATGFADILGEGKSAEAETFRDLLADFSRKGPTIGLLMATHLPPVLVAGGKRLLEKFLSAVRIMESKGTYVMRSTLEPLPELLEAGEMTAAEAYLDLVSDTFSQDVTYNQCLHLMHMLPKAVRYFASGRSLWTIPILARVVRTEILLAEPFLEGIENGLKLLPKKALDDFVSKGLEKLERSQKSAAGFLSLRSGLGRETFRRMQVDVPFSQARFRLDRYLRARTGMPLSAKPVSEAPKKLPERIDNELCVASDGRFIYLPDQVGIFDTPEENLFLYKCLARLETGLYEFGTFDFDMEKLDSGLRVRQDADEEYAGRDLECFFATFPEKRLASDLFTVFEHGRIRFLMEEKYPGMVRRAYPAVKSEIDRIFRESDAVHPVFCLYSKIAAGVDSGREAAGKWADLIDEAAGKFEKTISEKPVAEASALLVARFYADFEECFESKNSGIDRLGGVDGASPVAYAPFKAPFDRKIRPEFYFGVFGRYDDMAKKVKAGLRVRGVKVFKSDIRKKLMENAGRLSRADLDDVVLHASEEPGETADANARVDFSDLDLEGILGERGGSDTPAEEIDGAVFRYKEWDCHLGDYINDHVRILDRRVKEKEGSFYAKTLERHRGLVDGIRYAFELLKPEGLKILRPWTEGDDFDYRAMLDFAVDIKAGWLPSDRLYIKRMKQQRDVAVLLLTDLSKSTSNLVFESNQTVLDVEKEAIVLFCEALEVLGDKSAIAGFSGTGRLGVDYWRIKDFDEPLNDSVKERINAMSPQRSTRMGAAIRHATAQLEKTEALVRLLILLGDGFPNDADYKREYAIEDTRKAASEAFSKYISFKAITVNIAEDSKLDDLYGNMRHSVISDVRQLPDKLLRIYSALTRS